MNIGPAHEEALWVLAVAVAIALLLPKLTILLRGAFDGRNRRSAARCG